MSPPDRPTDAGSRPNPVPPLGYGAFGERAPGLAHDPGSSRARAVSADLEAIFAPVAAQGPETPRRGPGVRTLGGSRAASRPSRIAGLGAVAAALLAGVVLGSILLRPHPRPAAPPAPLAAAARLPPFPSAADLPARPAVVAAAPPERVQPKPAVRRAASSRAAVLAADRRLRRAYATAARAGVSRDILVAARSRWAATRNAHPTRVVAVYGALASDLERRAHRRRR